MSKSATGVDMPCLVCRCKEWCPDFGEPRQDCLEFWPLSHPASRQLPVQRPEDERNRRIALAHPEARAVAERWEAGGQISDDEYLLIRDLWMNAATEQAEDAYHYLLRAFLRPKMRRYIGDAIKYYQLAVTEESLQSLGTAAEGALLFADEQIVRGYTCAPVPSRFERVFLEMLKAQIWAYTIERFIDLPEQNDAFKTRVEREWRRVLFYENGFHGFTVIPLIHMDDLVRYQQIGGGDPLVSRSISHWIMYCHTAFPLPAQMLAPDFNDHAYVARIRKMYEPLVVSYAVEARKRLKAIAEKEGAPSSDVAQTADLIGEFEAVLQQVIEHYDFMYRKPEDVASSVGAVGFASSSEWRQVLQERLRQADLPIDAGNMIHVGFTGYVVGKFEEHLRENLPQHRKDHQELKGIGGTTVEGEGEAADVFQAESARTRNQNDIGDGVPVAFEQDGVQYLYIQQMAFVCGPEITEDQLRNWDRRGHLETLRMRDIDPGAPDTIADRRVYPYTNEMIERIQDLAEHKEMLQANPKEGVLSLKEAAKRLDISTRTLANWRRDGKIEDRKIEHRVFIPEDEVTRLLDEQDME